MQEEEHVPYFTEDMNKTIREMSDAEMFRKLLNFEESESFLAFVRYNQIRATHCQSSILAADPVTSPTLIARNQGIMLGLSDLQNAVIMLRQDKNKEAKENNSTDVE